VNPEIAISEVSASLQSANIRKANDADVPALAELRYALRASAGIVTEPQSEFLARCRAWMKEHLREGSLWHCWVAESDGQLIGNLWLQLVEKIPNPRSEPEHHAYLTNFYVQDSERGPGVGSRLLKTTLDWCKASHVHAVILWPTDNSRSLYQRYGFAVRSDLMELIIADAET